MWQPFLFLFDSPLFDFHLLLKSPKCSQNKNKEISLMITILVSSEECRESQHVTGYQRLSAGHSAAHVALYCHANSSLCQLRYRTDETETATGYWCACLHVYKPLSRVWHIPGNSAESVYITWGRTYHIIKYYTSEPLNIWKVEVQMLPCGKNRRLGKLKACRSLKECISPFEF